jgi:diguanylate cyclase (GGDEF)-like protein/PAS domain S-box-containing protein
MPPADDREVETLLRRAFEASPEAMALVGLEPGGQGRILRVNAALATMTGHPADEVVGGSLVDLADQDDVDGWVDLVDRAMPGPVEPSERRWRRADGTVRWVEVTFSPFSDLPGERLYALVRLLDVTERRATVEALDEAAHRDPLTGVLNRAGLLRRLGTPDGRSLPAGGRGALLFCDLDALKEVNDLAGHPAGDAVLRTTAARLTACVRRGDVVARVGGDEFVVVAFGIRDTAVDPLLRRITRGVAEPVLHGGQELRVQVSIGAAVLELGVTGLEEALRQADEAMYAAKRQGRTSAASAE